MKKATTEIFAQASALRKQGKSHKEIMEATGLSHSQMERHFVAEDIDQYGGFLKQPETQTAKAAIIAKLRQEGQSWGVISVRFKEPEGRTRKCFKEAFGIESAGMRIGKGGRFLGDDNRFYTGADRPKLGTELKAGVPALKQLPEDPNAEVKRKLPTFAKKGTETRKPRARKAAAPKA